MSYRSLGDVDDSVFRRDEKPTSRKAWDEVRDYTTREIQAKEALVGALKEAVVKELVRLKVCYTERAAVTCELSCRKSKLEFAWDSRKT
jgi:hypothetical protein